MESVLFCAPRQFSFWCNTWLLVANTLVCRNCWWTLRKSKLKGCPLMSRHPGWKSHWVHLPTHGNDDAGHFLQQCPHLKGFVGYSMLSHLQLKDSTDLTEKVGSLLPAGERKKDTSWKGHKCTQHRTKSTDYKWRGLLILSWLIHSRMLWSCSGQNEGCTTHESLMDGYKRRASCTLVHTSLNHEKAQNLVKMPAKPPFRQVRLVL